MTEFDKNHSELLAHFYAIGTDVVVMPAQVAEALDRLELAEVKGRMALEDANQRIEQLEELLHEVNRFAVEYAPFNSAMAKIQKMLGDGLHEEN